MWRLLPAESRYPTGAPAGQQYMKPFSLLVKPASADCNLRCEYCFYLGHRSFYPGESVHRMQEDVLDVMVRSYMSTPQPQYVFIWQGGEPTLMGVDFFRRAIELQKEHGRARNAVIANALQTNATMINEDMAKLFAEYRFLVGVSMDGPPEIHDTYRRAAGGGETHSAVLRGIELLEKHGVEFNILSLVSQSNVRRAAEVYRYLVDRRVNYHQYIPCVESGPDGRPAEFSVTGPEWGDFLCELFREWRQEGPGRVSVRLFDDILNRLVGSDNTVCHFGVDCRRYFVVEYCGDVYPCDFFVEKELLLGNVMTDAWDDMQRSEVYRDFGALKKQWAPECGDCRWQWLCAGDCIKNRQPGRNGEPRTLSRLCEGWKKFFDHSMPAFRELAEQAKESQRRQAVAMAGRAGGRVGRNDPCPCGSGKKFKKCCGRFA